MPQRTLPGLGLEAFFDLGENGWNDEVDENFRLLSFLVDGRAISRTTSLPGTGTAGDVYIVPSGDTNGNNIAIWDGASGSEAWVYYTQKEGWSFYVLDEDKNYQFDGTNWVEFAAAGSGGGSGSSGTVDFQHITGVLTADDAAVDFSGVFATIAWDAASSGSESGWAGANPSRVPVPSGATLVRVTAAVRVTDTADDQSVLARITKNGSANADEELPTSNTDTTTSSSSGGTINLVSAPIAVTDGDYFELEFFCADSSVTMHQNGTFLSVEVLEPKTASGGAGFDPQKVVETFTGSIDGPNLAITVPTDDVVGFDLVVEIPSTTGTNASVRFNSDSGGNYESHRGAIYGSTDDHTISGGATDTSFLTQRSSGDMDNVKQFIHMKVLQSAADQPADVIGRTYTVDNDKAVVQWGGKWGNASNAKISSVDLTAAFGAAIPSGCTYRLTVYRDVEVGGGGGATETPTSLAILQATVDQVLSASTTTQITFGASDDLRDVGDFWDSGSPSQFTVPAGVDTVLIGVSFQVDTSPGAAEYELFIRVNGTTRRYQRTSNDNWGGMTITTPLDVSENDVITWFLWSTDAITLRAEQTSLSIVDITNHSVAGGGGGGGGGGASALNDLTDVAITSAVLGHMLIHDGTTFKNVMRHALRTPDYDLSAGDQTISAADFNENSIFVVASGAVADNDLIVSASSSIPRQFMVINDSAVQIQVTKGSTNIALAANSAGIFITKGGANDLVAVSGSGGGGASALGDLTNVTLTSAADGDRLIRRSGVWVNEENTLADMEDMGATVDGDAVVRSGAGFIGVPFQNAPRPSQFGGALINLTSDISATAEVVAWDEAAYDTDSIWPGAGVDESKLVVPAGVTKVKLHAIARFTDDNEPGSLVLRKNGAGNFLGSARSPLDGDNDGASFGTAFTTPVIDVVGGDFFQVELLGTTGTMSWRSSESCFAMEIIERAGGVINPLPRNYIDGFVMSNDAGDADHDINVLPGQAYGSAGDAIELLSEMTKQIDASWAAGNNAGGLSSSLTLAADTWYHVFAIIVAGAHDIGFDTDVNAANLITDHSAASYRRIGSVRTDASSNILGFVQDGDTFIFGAVQEQNLEVGTALSPTLVTIDAAPLGIRTQWLGMAAIIESPGISESLLANLYPADLGSTVNIALGRAQMTRIGNLANNNQMISSLSAVRLITNTSSQLRLETTNANQTVFSGTYGWVDSRGKE